MANVLQTGRKHCGKKEKLLLTSNFSFPHSVFIRLVLLTRKNQGLFGKGLNDSRKGSKYLMAKIKQRYQMTTFQTSESKK